MEDGLGGSLNWISFWGGWSCGSVRFWVQVYRCAVSGVFVSDEYIKW